MDDFCCKHHYAAAKAAAWEARLKSIPCGCDHNESCHKCYPPEFREGGKFNMTPAEWEEARIQAAADRRAKRLKKWRDGE